MNTSAWNRLVHRLVTDDKAMMWTGGAIVAPVLAAVVLLAVFVPPSTHMPITTTTMKPPIDILPNVVGMTGYEGQQAIKTATSNRVYASLVDAVPVGCTKLAPGDAPIVRTDPLAGAEVTPPSRSGIGGPPRTAVLYVDRSAGEPCDPPPRPSPPGNTNIDIPDVHHNDDNHHRPWLCRHTTWC